MQRTSLILLIAIGHSSPSIAHWQYTRWGMTPEQVVVAANGSAVLHAGTAAESTISGNFRAKGQYVSGDYKFQTGFIFNDRGLSQVKLKPASMEQCENIGIDLAARYGAPDEFRKLPMNIFSIRWTDAVHENSIRFNGMSDGSCELNYMPLKPIQTNNAKGL